MNDNQDNEEENKQECKDVRIKLPSFKMTAKVKANTEEGGEQKAN